MTIYAWGPNPRGVLGIGGTTGSASPVVMPTALDIVAIAMLEVNGFPSSLFLTSGGDVYAAGSNHVGQLGQGTTDTLTHDVPVHVSSLSNIVKIAGGGNGECWALDGSGNLYAWGGNGFGQFGIGNTSNQSTPQLSATGVVDVAPNQAIGLILKSGGVVQTAGLNGTDCSLVNGSSGGSSSTWVTVTPGSGTVIGIANGAGCQFLLMADGTVRGGGRAAEGQLGLPLGSAGQPNWVTLPISDVRLIHAAINACFMTKNDDTTWAIGVDGDGRLGSGGTGNTATPVQVLFPAGVYPLQYGPNIGSATIALGSDHLVYVWGLGSSGQAGDGLTNSHNVPYSNNGLTDVAWVGGGRNCEWASTGGGAAARGRSWAQVIG